MPGTLERFPPAMGHLTAPVLERAIAIANALLAQGYGEGTAIRITITRAKAWGARRGIASRETRFDA